MTLLTNRWGSTTVQTYSCNDWTVFSSTGNFSYSTDYWMVRHKDWELTIDFFPPSNWGWYFGFANLSDFKLLDMPSFALRVRRV